MYTIYATCIRNETSDFWLRISEICEIRIGCWCSSSLKMLSTCFGFFHLVCDGWKKIYFACTLHIGSYPCVCVCVYTMLKNTCTRIVNGKHLILKDVNSKSSNPLIQNVNCWNGSQSTHRNCKNDDGTFLFPIWMEIYYILFSRMERI